jgi:hypothetical protein
VQFGRDLVLADEKAVSQFHSPFRTVGTLTTFIAERLQEPA